MGNKNTDTEFYMVFQNQRKKESVLESTIPRRLILMFICYNVTVQLWEYIFLETS